MRDRATRGLAWSLGGLGLAFFVAGMLITALGSSGSGPRLTSADRLLFAAFLAYVAVGALVAARLPANPIGWLLLAEGLLFEFAGFTIGYVNYALFAHPGSLPAGNVVAWAGNSIWIPSLTAAALVLLIFPDGRLRSSRWRPVVGVGLVLAMAAFASEAFAPGSLGGSLETVNNPFGIAGGRELLSAVGAAGNAIGGPLLIGAALLCVPLRFRGANRIEREQLRWLAYAAALLALSFTAGEVLQEAGAPTSVYPLFYLVPLIALPIAIGVAVLRHRLYGIDVIIDRTVVVAALAGLVTCVYLAVVVGIGAAVGRGGGSNVVLAAVATAVLAVVFEPARDRAQRLARRAAYGKPSPREQASEVVVHSLGVFRVFRDGAPIPATTWQSKKARTLLKILIARRGRSTPRDLLMDAMWPEQDPVVLANRLSVALATVRAVLDPHKRHPTDYFVATQKDSVRLDLDHVAVDVEDFLRRSAAGMALYRAGQTSEGQATLAEAESSYAGDFLEEDPYEDWACDLREETRAAYVAVARALAERSAEAGDDDTAVRYYLRILDKDRWDQGAHLGLVSVLERAGRHGDAHRQYDTYASRMGELDLPPSPYPA